MADGQTEARVGTKPTELTSPLILNQSKDELKEEPPDTEGWFDKLTMSEFRTLHQP